MKLRLLVTKICHRSCAGCCNKDWDLDNLPIADLEQDYELIMVTGGEPLLECNFDKTMQVLKSLPLDAEVIVYTTLSRNVHKILRDVDGVTLTLHEQEDVEEFLKLNDFLLRSYAYHGLSMRLNVFAGIEIPKGTDLSRWKVKDNITWIENCPLPEDEIFARI